MFIKIIRYGGKRKIEADSLRYDRLYCSCVEYLFLNMKMQYYILDLKIHHI